MRWTLAALLCLTFTCTTSGQTRNVEGKATGRYYNSVWKNWTDQPVSVYVDDKANVYISAGDGILNSTGYIAGKLLPQVGALLQKTIDWSKKAKANQIETTKPLGSFVTGTQTKKQGIELTLLLGRQG